MACLQHNCSKCEEMWFDNELKSLCPNGCKERISTYFDEQPEEANETETFED